jgi:tRNA pseudouridine55 synthase
MTPQPFGLININKPRGETSRWVVNQVQQLIRPTKVGHAGTLDPLATGVLVVAVGPATRLVEYVQMMRKSYRAEFLLGRVSPTEDIEGDVKELENPAIPSFGEIEDAAQRLVGEIMQRPPAFSALKVAGKRAYKLARQGNEVVLAERPITVYKFEIVEYDYPRLVANIECSSGTYVRSLGRDLAELLGTGAVMSVLERTAIGSFTIQDAIELSQIKAQTLTTLLLPPSLAVAELQSLVLSDDQVNRIRFGQLLELPSLLAPPNAAVAPRDFAAFDACGNLAAVIRQRPDGLFGPIRNLVGQ